MTRGGEQNELFIVSSVFGDRSPSGIFRDLNLAAVRLLGFTRRPRVSLMLRTHPSSSFSFSICSRGVNRSRAGGARRPVRTEPLPTTLSDALCLEQSFSSSSSFSFSICSRGVNRGRAGGARRPVRTEPLPTALSDASCLKIALKPYFGAAEQCRSKSGEADGCVVVLVGQIFTPQRQGEMRVQFPTSVGTQNPIVSQSNELCRED
jgi:hypothetical protein